MVRDTVLPKDVTQEKSIYGENNNIGARIDPWGTPHTKETDMEEKLSIFTAKSFREEANNSEKPTKTLKINTISLQSQQHWICFSFRTSRHIPNVAKKWSV